MSKVGRLDGAPATQLTPQPKLETYNDLDQRRTVLRTFAAASVLAAGGLVWRAWDSGVFASGEGRAYEPWANWREDAADRPMAIVLASILAANAHNNQPWRFDVGPDRIAVFADTSRHLGSFDPFRREMMLSLGCALENMLRAARAEGYRPRIVPLAITTPGRAACPRGDTRAVCCTIDPALRVRCVRRTHRGVPDPLVALGAGRITRDTVLVKQSGRFPRAEGRRTAQPYATGWSVMSLTVTPSTSPVTS